MFEKMAKNALANLQNNESQINEMNVFPVTDGDTGTNMLLTLAHGIEHAQSNEHLGKYLKQFSKGMLLGARGNSGVILSQIFKGFSVIFFVKKTNSTQQFLFLHQLILKCKADIVRINLFIFIKSGSSAVTCFQYSDYGGYQHTYHCKNTE